jgi:hypothetical protein
MKRLYLLAFVLLLGTGCAGPEWNDFWKDLRGDNMEMRGFGKASTSHSPAE